MYSIELHAKSDGEMSRFCHLKRKHSIIQSYINIANIYQHTTFNPKVNEQKYTKTS